uniref:Kinesin motor domain-containing protein n=1 Tax=Timema shepardi TaxID=629360 RepID=A0A7R9ATX7_TIMSH|nr:unnamed protein product [Timema shepardi]
MVQLVSVCRSLGPSRFFVSSSLLSTTLSSRVDHFVIAMVSPGMSSCEHSLNTLRYADRVKELAANDPVEIKNSPSDDETMHVEGAHGLDDSDLAQLRSLNVQSPGDFGGQTLVLWVLLVGVRLGIYVRAIEGGPSHEILLCCQLLFTVGVAHRQETDRVGHTRTRVWDERSDVEFRPVWVGVGKKVGEIVPATLAAVKRFRVGAVGCWYWQRQLRWEEREFGQNCSLQT